ncbi:glycosyltransferase [Gemmatimonadota bacterium]
MIKSNQRTGGPNYRVHWRVSPSFHVLELSSVACGISDLRRCGEIELEMSLQRPDDAAEHILLLSVKELRTGQTRSIGIDHFDRSDLFCRATLESVDVYFKRNYWKAETKSLPDHLRRKIVPAGLTFACRTEHSETLLLRAALMALWNRLGQRSKFSLTLSFSRLRWDLLQMLGFLKASDWERAEGDTARKRIVFQTRVYGSDEVVDRSDVNASRIALVRALRREFGSPETIGLLDCPPARELAPDAVLSPKVRRARYAGQLRTSVVAVNSHGLDGSAGLKVGESLAAGCALVSEPFHVELPEPIVPQIHYLAFEDPEECVLRCRYLLENDEIANRMRAANLKYYRENVRPLAMVRNLLQRAFSSTCDGF